MNLKTKRIILATCTLLIWFTGITGTQQVLAQAADMPNLPSQGVADRSNSWVKVEQSSGAATQSYPIALPAGRNGLTPSLGLSYNSQRQNNENLAGYGWDMTQARITRNPKFGVNQMFQEDQYILDLFGSGGEFIRTQAGPEIDTYGLKIEDSTFLKIEKLHPANAQATWRVTDPQGTIYLFGTSDMSRQHDRWDEGRIFGWYLERIQDANGNAIDYTYRKPESQIYPETITYADTFRVHFEYEQRPDTYRSYAKGFSVETAQRILNIEVSANNRVRARHDFSYIVGSNGARSLLSSIQETDFNEDGTSLQPRPTTFHYNVQELAFTDANANFTIPGWQHFNGRYSGMDLTDVNGDGYADAVGAPYGANYEHNGTYINQRDGSFVLDQNWLPPLGSGINIDNTDTGTRMIDMDADIKPDFLNAIFGPGANFGTLTICRNNGSGWNQTSGPARGCTIVPFNQNFSFSPNYDFLADIDGDGHFDILQSYISVNQNNREAISVVYSSRTGFQRDNSWTFPFPFRNVNQGADNGVRPSDMNSDGLVDLISASGMQDIRQGIFINNGHNTFGDTTWRWVGGAFVNSWEQQSPSTNTIADFNGDGLQDVGVVFGQDQPMQFFINQGTGNFVRANVTLPYDFGKFGMSGDVNADGRLDIILKNCWDRFGSNNIQQQVEACEQRVYLGAGGIPDVMTEVSTPDGARSVINYKSSAQYVNVDNQPLNMGLPLSVMTVDHIDQYDGMSPTAATTNYVYEQGYFYAGDNALERYVTGFGKITETDPLGNKTVSYFHQGGGLNGAALGENEDSIQKRGRPFRQEVYDTQGQKKQQIVYTWQEQALDGGGGPYGHQRYFVWQSNAQTTQYDGAAKSTATSSTYDTATGNITQQISWGEVAADGSDIGSDRKTVDYRYVTTAAGVVTGFVSEKIITDLGGTEISHQRFYYDGLALGRVERGNTTREESLLISENRYVGTQSTYNEVGLVTSTTDALGNVTTITYGADNLYPASVTNTLTQREQFTYDTARGNVLTKIDANNNTWRFQYDARGRMTRSTGPAGEVLKEAIYTDNVTPSSITERTYSAANTYTEQISFYDGLNRLVEKRATSEVDARYSVTHMKYNLRGELIEETLPAFEQTSGFTPYPAGAVVSSYSYDALGRSVQTTTPAGTTTTSFGPWSATVTDANSHRKTVTKNADGQLISMTEYLGGAAKVTSYSYDSAGNMTRITDAAGNIRNMRYDAFGRRTVLEDVHAPADQTFATWTYTYDDNGNVLSNRNVEGNAITYVYDALGRQIREDDATTTGVDITYTYDAGAQSVGRLSSAVRGNVTTSFAYDSFGRTTSETKRVGAEQFVTAYQYNLRGDVTNTTMPNGRQIASIYNNAGLIETIPGTVTSKDYNAAGQVTSMSLANGVTSQFTYDNTQRLTNKTTARAGVTLQNLNYQYDGVGNVSHIVESANTQVKRDVTYGYDELDRLLSARSSNTAAGTTAYDLQYSYDILGNILNKPSVGSYQYAQNGFANPHAVTSITLPAYFTAAPAAVTPVMPAAPAPALTPVTPSPVAKISNTVIKSPAIAAPKAISTKPLTLSSSIVANVPAPEVFTYDANGNLLANKTKEFTWSLRNELLSVRPYGTAAPVQPSILSLAPGALASPLVARPLTAISLTPTIDPIIYFSYDHNGERVTKKGPTSKVTYVSGSYEVEDISGIRTTRVYVYDGTNLVSTVEQVSNSPVVTTYAHSDHLGSSSLVTDSGGTIVQQLDYLPYGEERVMVKAANTSDLSKKYTGKELDEETGLYYYGARYYDPRIARFVSADPVARDVGDERPFSTPQGWNTYSYTENNPVKYIDPDGQKVSEFQPYLPKNGKVYDLGEKFGVYRGVKIFSGGEKTAQLSNPYQCARLAKKFVLSQFAITLNGNGDAYGNQNAMDASFDANNNKKIPGLFTVYQNGGIYMPQEDDLISWSGGKWGHVGFIVEVTLDESTGKGSVYTLEENYSRNNALFVQPLTRTKNEKGQFIYDVGDRSKSYHVQGWSRNEYKSTMSPKAKYTSTSSPLHPKPAIRDPDTK